MRHVRLKKSISGATASLVLLASLFPLIVSAATFKTVVEKVLIVFNSAVKALIGLAVFLLAFGIFRYINAGADPKRRIEGGKLLMWGIISVFVMVSLWGLVNILLNTFFSPADTASFNLSSQLWNTPN